MSCPLHFWLNFAVSVAVALGTLSAVVVALFGRRWYPPRLKMDILDKLGEKTFAIRRVSDALSEDHEVRFFHIKVWNERRWSTANQTQVFLIAIEEKGANDQWQVKWTGNVPMRWRDQEVTPFTQTIGAPRDSDFCMVDKDTGVISLMPLIAPNNLKVHRKGPCKFIARLQARCTEKDSEELSVQVSWDGGWEDGNFEMRRDHLQVDIYEKPSQ
jgi:hypothetical protein